MRFMIREIFTFIDTHNDTGVNAEMLYEAGLFSRQSDAASWLSRWKSKGYLRTQRETNTNVRKEPIKPRLRYFTITDNSQWDWSTLIGKSNLQIREMRLAEQNKHAQYSE